MSWFPKSKLRAIPKPSKVQQQPGPEDDQVALAQRVLNVPLPQQDYNVETVPTDPQSWDQKAGTFPHRASWRRIPGRIRTAKTSAGKTYEFIDLGGPYSGRVWEIRHLAITGPDPWAAAVNNIVVLMIDGQAPQDSNNEPVSFPGFEEAPGQIPNSIEYGKEEQVLKFGEHLILGFKGLTNGTSYVITCSYQDFDETFYMSAFEVEEEERQ